MSGNSDREVTQRLTPVRRLTPQTLTEALDGFEDETVFVDEYGCCFRTVAEIRAMDCGAEDVALVRSARATLVRVTEKGELDYVIAWEHRPGDALPGATGAVEAETLPSSTGGEA